MRAIICLTAIAFLFFLQFAKPTFAAAELYVNNIPTTIDQQQEFEVNINFLCSGCSDSYLRGVFYPSGSSYFGYTQDNSGNWSNSPGANCTTYFKIAETDLTPEGSWSGKLKFKPDINSSYYSSPGEYLFKVGRYTPSCGSPSLWSQETTIAITGPTPTPTNTPTPTPTSAPAPTSTPTKTPTPTPTPIKTPSPIPTLKLSPSPTPKKVLPTSVLGESTESGLIIYPTASESVSEKNVSTSDENKDSNFNIQKVFILIGGIFLIACTILLFRFFVKNKQEE